jgi:hypothetical protein
VIFPFCIPRSLLPSFLAMSMGLRNMRIPLEFSAKELLNDDHWSNVEDVAQGDETSVDGKHIFEDLMTDMEQAFLFPTVIPEPANTVALLGLMTPSELQSRNGAPNEALSDMATAGSSVANRATKKAKKNKKKNKQPKQQPLESPTALRLSTPSPFVCSLSACASAFSTQHSSLKRSVLCLTPIFNEAATMKEAHKATLDATPFLKNMVIRIPRDQENTGPWKRNKIRV